MRGLSSEALCLIVATWAPLRSNQQAYELQRDHLPTNPKFQGHMAGGLWLLLLGIRLLAESCHVPPHDTPSLKVSTPLVT